MFIFKWLASLLDKARKLLDPWEQLASRGWYIGKFRKELEAVADDLSQAMGTEEFEAAASKLSQTMGTIRVRLNEKTAEFYDTEGKVIAQVEMYGGGSILPCNIIIVTFDASFPESLKRTFDSVLPGCEVLTNHMYLNQ